MASAAGEACQIGLSGNSTIGTYKKIAYVDTSTQVSIENEKP
jgi:hypothetical protein